MVYKCIYSNQSNVPNYIAKPIGSKIIKRPHHSYCEVKMVTAGVTFHRCQYIILWILVQSIPEKKMKSRESLLFVFFKGLRVPVVKYTYTLFFKMYVSIHLGKIFFWGHSCTRHTCCVQFYHQAFTHTQDYTMLVILCEF